MDTKLTERDGRRALRDHLLDKAAAARERHGPVIDGPAMMRLLDDRSLVRYPVGVRFDSAPLQPGEFAFAAPLGERPEEGFCLFIHPAFEHRPDLWPALIAYHLPPINYGEIADTDDCEQFGAALTGATTEEYYALLCALSDSLPERAAAE
jgi:hypothetical protein